MNTNPEPRTPSLAWLAGHNEAITVACTDPAVPYCRAPVGEDCVDPTGQPLVEQPAHWRRRVEAAAQAGHILDAPEPAEEPAGRRASLTRAGTGRTRCNHCDRPLRWVLTRNRVWMPIDAEPSDRGNVYLSGQGSAERAEVIGKRNKAAAMRAAGVPLYLHHAVTCPFARLWASGKAADKNNERRTR